MIVFTDKMPEHCDKCDLSCVHYYPEDGRPKECPLHEIKSREIAHEILCNFRNHFHCNPESIDSVLDKLGYKEVGK